MGRKGSEDSHFRTNDSMSSTSDQSSEEVESTFGQLHVLAVDDSIIDRKVIEKLLENSCYKVTTVDSGKNALEFLGLGDDQNSLDELEVNMIITDYSMPGMSGYDLLKRVKDSSKLKEIPVVVMSSENVSSRKSRCLDEGAEDFIVKPVQVSDVKRLRNYMANRHLALIEIRGKSQSVPLIWNLTGVLHSDVFTHYRPEICIDESLSQEALLHVNLKRNGGIVSYTKQSTTNVPKTITHGDLFSEKS